MVFGAQDKKTRTPLYKTKRLAGYDYCQKGFYAICIHAIDRKRLFEIPALKTLLMQEWDMLTAHFADAIPDSMVVMPDHLHAILQMNGDDVAKVHSLSQVMCGYKSMTATAWIRHLKLVDAAHDAPWKIWQSGFHDHIIRNEADLKLQRGYLHADPHGEETRDQLDGNPDSECVICSHLPFPL